MLQREIRMSEPTLTYLANWIANFKYEDIPSKSLRAARLQVLDMIAAVYASSRLEEAQAVERGALASTGEHGRATLLSTGKKTNPVDAAAINAAYSMAQDFDDIIWMGHTGHSSVFASLAVAEHEEANTREFLTAVVVANEVAGRLGASCFLGPLNGQMITHIHLIGAAAATAKLLKLDTEQTTHALAISLSQPVFALQPAFMAPSSKLLSAATPTRIGIQAAYFAREGITGEPTLLEDSRGFWNTFAFIPLPDMMKDLGEFWAIQTLSMKTYPGCHYFQTACTAIKMIREKRKDFELNEIVSVQIATTKFGIEVNRFGAEYSSRSDEITAVNVNFDLATTAAILLHAGKLTSHEVDSVWLSTNAEVIQKIRKKITVTHDPALTLMVLKSGKALPTGRKALGKLTLSNLLKLRARYSKDYHSSLFSPKELAKWLRVGAHELFQKSALLAKGDFTLNSAIPLYFPNRVTIQFGDGTKETVQVDLPVGAFCSPLVESAIREKFLREAGHHLPPEMAAIAFESGLELESLSLSRFLAILERTG